MKARLPKVSRTRVLICIGLLLLSAGAPAQYEGQYRYGDVERVVAIGDLQGEIELRKTVK